MLFWGNSTVSLNLDEKDNSVVPLLTLCQVYFHCYNSHRFGSVTSLQYCARISLNFIIICRLMASRERICLNFKSISNAASADRSVLKDSSIKCFASFSITWQKQTKKAKKKTLRTLWLSHKKQNVKKEAKQTKSVSWEGFPLYSSGSYSVSYSIGRYNSLQPQGL